MSRLDPANLKFQGEIRRLGNRLWRALRGETLRNPRSWRRSAIRDPVNYKIREDGKRALPHVLHIPYLEGGGLRRDMKHVNNYKKLHWRSPEFQHRVTCRIRRLLHAKNSSSRTNNIDPLPNICPSLLLTKDQHVFREVQPGQMRIEGPLLAENDLRTPGISTHYFPKIDAIHLLVRKRRGKKLIIVDNLVL